MLSQGSIAVTCSLDFDPGCEMITLISQSYYCFSRGGISLSEVRVAEGESIEAALKRFKKKIQKAGILSEIKRRERYEKPSVKRKRKAEAARKRRS